jgi:hypothetical protein
MKILSITVIILLLFIPSATFAVEADSNSVLHFGYSLVFGVFGETLLHYNLDMSAPSRIFYATVIGSIPGLAKEVKDNSDDGGHFSGSDMAFDVAGAFTGSVISNYINNKVRVNVTHQSDGAMIRFSYNF